MIPRRSVRWAFLLLVLASPGCSPAAEVSQGEPAGAVPVATLSPPVVVLGTGGTVFGDVAGAVRLRDGRIVVADAVDGALRFFSSEGRLLARVGGVGDGPGEFRTIQAIGRLPGDTVWVHDFAHQRVTFVSPEPHVARVVSLEPRVGPGLAAGVTDEGTVVVGEAWSSRVSGADRPGLNREPVAYVRYDDGGTLRDTIAVVPGREVLLSTEDGRAVMAPAPFGRTAVHALVGEQLVVGDQTERRLVRYGLDGRVLGSLQWDGPDLQLTPEWVSDWRAERLSAAEPGQRARVERELAETRLPDRRPAYGAILGAGDAVWVAEYALPGAEPDAWLILGLDGEARARVETPGRFRPVDVDGDRVLGVARDAYEVQTVELRRVRLAEGG